MSPEPRGLDRRHRLNTILVVTSVASLALAISLAATGASAGGSERTLSVADAMSALHSVGVTKTFTVSRAGRTLILVTGGGIAVQPLIVNVFPSARAARSYMAAYPPPPPAIIHIVVPGEGQGLPRKLVCNVMVSSTVLPALNVAHPTIAERRVLEQFLAKVRAAQARVVANLRQRCAG